MSTIRSVDFLPEIFQTDANRQFLAATLDQLIQEPKFKKTEGFIGRRAGPGVNPRDRYVDEPTRARSNYQLEPSVVSLVPDTERVKDAVTYSGINDTVAFNGGIGARPDRLYESEYYTWDPFIDFDKFVNFSQYFWVPGGPDTVDVGATEIPVQANFPVTRQDGAYQFKSISGNNPVIELIRGGNYTFQVSQNDKETINYRVRNSGSTAFVIDFENNPSLSLARGNTYVFNLTTSGQFPFWIKTEPTTGRRNAFDQGVTRNGAVTGLVTFTVPQDAPDILYYIAENQSAMQGIINVVDSAPGSGPGFWIQTAPGIDGRLPQSPNISSRDVFGVENNGEDLGTVTFNVPLNTAQSFYYDLPSITPVDLITELPFDQINNQPVESFISQFRGIDGITDLNGRTLIFAGTSNSGWVRTSLFDPLSPETANANAPGSYDSIPFDLTTPIAPSDQRQVWQINYVRYNGDQFITLSKVIDVAQLTKFSIRYGTKYSSTQWFKNSVGVFEQIPLLSAAQDTLFYQDGTDPEIFGRIRLIDPIESATIFVDEILGSKSYTSPTGVVFTNGLRVRFTGSVEPARFRSGLDELTYTQTESGSNYITSLQRPELDINQLITFTSPTLGGLEAGKNYYVRSISANGLKFTVSEEPAGPVVILQNGQGTSNAVTVSNREFYVSGVGDAIRLLPVELFLVPEEYAKDSSSGTITTEPANLDYITISRSSRDRNAWSRSNRWFHIDVINAAAAYNNTTVILDNELRAKRPIIEFRSNIRLWNMGTEGKAPVDIIDFSEVDAFSNIEGSTGYAVDGYNFVEGSRVIFAADTDPDVRNKIYQVSFVKPDTVEPLIEQPIINLTLAEDGVVELDQSTVVLNGTTTEGKTYWYTGVEWVQAQQKTSVQQAPLFNVYDRDGISFGDESKYQSTTFAGSKLFSYARGDSSLIDPVLQFPLQYLNINNVGDIVFENNLYRDTFLYVVDNASQTVDISSGVVREYSLRSEFGRLLGWQTAAVPSQVYQQFEVDYRGDTIKLDIPVKDQTKIAVPVIKIYIDGLFQDQSTYTYNVFENQTFVSFIKDVAIGEIIELRLLSDKTSNTGFYQVPINFESNPLNANPDSFTLGTIRTHYQSICENLIDLRGPVTGANNVRDLGNIIPFGLEILQQSAPLTLTGYFLRSDEYNIFEALTYNSREYTKFKAKLLDAVTQQDIQFKSTAEVLDEALDLLNFGKVESQPFYWGDMLPSGVAVASNTYTISFITTNVFDTVQVYNYQSANYLGLLVYKNNNLLVRGKDYTVATDGPRITILTSLSVGDRLTVNEYNLTAGSFAPNTPTKLGLYPAWEPQITVQDSTQGPVTVIVGHDGSVTPVFGDLRDQVLLEFETRIYNNLKLDNNPVPLTVDAVLPGQFRSTGYTLSEINNIFAQDFLSYVGWNKLDYQSQNFNAADEFTWNYSTATNKLDNQEMPAAWRGVNRYFYDTQQPALTPWEMLGFSSRPRWWNDRYGPAPYTRDNLVLWDDIESGFVADPDQPYINLSAVRPGLTKVIPAGSEGELISPYKSVVGSINEQQIRRGWNIGDGGPVEASWWNSSAYPFSVMRVLALTKPAKFFALFADRDAYRYNEDLKQYLFNDRFRLDANGIEVYGDGVSKASYINWIVDYNRTVGVDSTQRLSDDLRSIDVRLSYRMASFSDKQYIKLFTEKSSPTSVNTALMIPDESYDLLLYKNQPFDRLIYSSVAVQKTESGGYAVFGYSTQRPYFNILVSQSVGKLQTYSAGGVSVRVPTFYSDTVLQVPYGFVFESLTSVADFLLSYGKYLEKQGLSFTGNANGYVLDWPRMVQEFLYWSQQGWDTDAIINLNPLASGLQVTKPLGVANNIVATTADSNILDQNSRDFPVRNLNVVRLDNTFKLEPLNNQAVSFADINFVNYEHLVILNNRSVFGDLIYDPTTGARQSRLKIAAITTTDWNGTVNAPGFILNQDNVEEWTGQKTYSKGEIVKYKDAFWSALKIVQPSESFNFSEWTQSDYEQVELGLLPNISNKANQLVNSYNINSANIESDNDLLSYGLIGFRPRQYMAALNLDDVSQVNIYQQFLKNKGTTQSSNVFQGANLGKETADYDVYENWAVQRATYGANANRSFVELRLDKSKLSSNPSLIQVVLPEQSTTADQSILLNQVWQQSYRLSSPEYLPTTIDNTFKNALPSSGYVNLGDADITVFDINDPESLNANFDQIQVGTTIWVAKINDFDWNIYQAIQVPGQIQHVCDNLNGTSRVIFSNQHNLAVGDKLIVKSFDDEINGIYTVLSIPALDVVNIAFQFLGDRTVANGTGIGLTLQTMRVAQSSDVVTLPYTTDLRPGARVWVDNNGENLWQVIKKQEIFSGLTSIAPLQADSTEQYGASIAQSSNQLAMFVGSPGYGFNTAEKTGAVYVYVKGPGTEFEKISPLPSTDGILTLSTTGVRGYGNSVDFGDLTWAAAGASRSLGPNSEPNNGYVSLIYRDPVLGRPDTIPYAQWQLLTQPNTTPSGTDGAGEFGYSVAVSQDERWLYVGAPGLNSVHAYSRVDVENQVIRVRGDGSTTVYDISDAIQIDQGTQLRVLVNGTVQKLNVDFTVDGNFESIEFISAPPEDALIDVQRIFIQQLDAENYFDVVQSLTSGAGTGARFTITRLRNVVNIGSTATGSGYEIGDTITIEAAVFDGGISPTNDLVLTVTSIGAGGGLAGFTTSYTAPALQTVFALDEKFFTVNNINSFTALITVGGNESIYRPNIDYTFDDVTKELTFVTVPPAGAVIVIRAQQYFKYVDTITVPGLANDARFGHAVSCTTDGRQLLVGAPNVEVIDQVQAGAVYVFDRNVQRFVVDTAGSSQTITVNGTPAAPVQVLLNNEFLINQENGLLGQSGSFTWSGTDQVTITADLSVGDQIEIETNQFVLIQTVVQNQVEAFSNYGSAVDLCSNNCSLYVGAPQSSAQIYKGGIAERVINQSRTFGIIESLNAPTTLTPGHTLRINNQDVAVPNSPNNTLINFANTINALTINVSASISSNGRLTLSVKNPRATEEFNKLQVAPGTVGDLFDVIGFETYVWTQTIVSPFPVDYAGFGSALSINSTATNLVVGAPRGTIYIFTDFDQGTAVFDIGSTVFFTDIPQSGAIYTYDFLSASSPSKTNPSKFAFGEQLGNPDIRPYDGFGTAVSYVSGILVAGAPRRTSSESNIIEQGQVYTFANPKQLPAWSVIQEQQPTVDIRLLNSVFLYDIDTSTTTEFLDFINPLQGKILGAARQNIDYVSTVDPAAYNTGPVNVRGTTWGIDHVGEIWWDTSTVRFIDPNQDSITYASRRWAQTFPGSAVDVYQWISSDVPPSAYTGSGTVRNTSSYTVNSRLQPDGLLVTEFYFWVRSVPNTLPQSKKTLPASVVADYIANPQSSGIPYIAPINGSTVALYNTQDSIEANDTVLHVEFDRIFTNDNVHVEYELIPQERADGFLSDNLYRKFQDSLCGADTFGNQVPDPSLSPAQRYGVQFRPRQSMFVDRFEALKNYLTKVNNILKRFPIEESRSFNLLNSRDPQPLLASGQWDFKVANLEELSFQNIDIVELGYRYLVDSDSSNRGLWTIYEVVQLSQDRRGLRLAQVQLFNTADYWKYIDWFRPGFNPNTKALTKVRNFSNLSTLNLPIGAVVEVEANARGKFELYQFTDTGWQRVGLEDGTIEFSAELYDYALGRFGFDIEVFDAQYFDQEPVTETRKIIQAINQELLVDDLAIERNRALILMFDYVLGETAAPEWLVKTSLIDVDHRIRDLVPYQNFIQDNQEFVEQYIQEVKPYHVQIREFNLQYNGSDQFDGDLVDFDLPAFFDTSPTVPQFVSPILLPYEVGTAFNALINTVSDVPSDSELWTTWPYSQWINNFGLTVKNIVITAGGSGYTELPEVVIEGDAVVPAVAIAVTNAANQIIGVEIINPGFGYRATPTIRFESGNGTGARAYARMIGRGLASIYNNSEPAGLVNYNLSRFVKTTLKFDRYQYQSSIENWQPNVIYQNGDLVRFNDQVWRANNLSGNTVTSAQLNFEDWEQVPAGELTGVDRTQGYYVPGINLPGRNLPLLIDGIEYPGPQVFGQSFLGVPALDAEYRSEFTDTQLGERFSDVNVKGGEFVGRFEGHAPQELVNGSEFDTVDIKVFTRPGSDWTNTGHGFRIGTIRYTYQPTVTDQYSWEGVVNNPAQVLVSNLSTGLELANNINYVIDWDDQYVRFISGVTPGDVVNISVYEVGGGSQLYRENYNGVDIDQTVIIPVNAAEIDDVAVFVNGEIADQTIAWLPYADSISWSIIESYTRDQVVLEDGNYYRAIDNVPQGTPLTNVAFWSAFTPTLNSIVDLGQQYSFDDGILLIALGITEPIQRSWSTPQIQTVVATPSIAVSKTIPVSNSIIGTNPANLILIRNGRRLQPAEGIEWIGDGSTVSFGLPQRGGYQQDIIDAALNVKVWVDGVLQVQGLGADPGDFSVSNWDGSNVPGRQVVFNNAPVPGSTILISVDVAAEYFVVGAQIQIDGVVNQNDVFQIITWNDTSEQRILTEVFNGPTTSGVTLTEPYDSTDFDVGILNNESGSFDFTQGVAVANNNFNLDRGNVNPSRLWVTLNGFRLFEGTDYTAVGNEVVLASGTIGPTDVLVVTQFTNSIVPDALGFRIFQDMRGVQATYKITDRSTTELMSNLTATSDVIVVRDARLLGEPNLQIGQFGVVTINGERITYRNRDLATNSLSGLRRGTAGTAAADHAAGSIVYDISIGSLLFNEFQDRIVQDTMFGDLSTTTFVAPSIVISPQQGDSVEVYVGGARQYSVSSGIESEYAWNLLDTSPVTIDFVDLVPTDIEITVLVRQGRVWYQQGANTASDGRPLQETDTLAARFLRGL